MFIGRDNRNGVLKASPPDQVEVGGGTILRSRGNQSNQGPRPSWSVARVIFHADILEHVSIDEAFLDVTSKVKGFNDAADYALRVKAAVKERERLACTIGVAPNKSVAKMASDLAKPDGLKVVRPEEVNAFLDS